MKLNLVQLVDLVFEKPADGTVNIKLLHSLLHILVERLKFDNVPIEYSGRNSEKYSAEIDKLHDHKSVRDFILERGMGGSSKENASYDMVNQLIEANAEAQKEFKQILSKMDQRLCEIECSLGESVT
jgi:hypothetical protein